MKKRRAFLSLLLALCFALPAYAAPPQARTVFPGTVAEPFTLTYPVFPSGIQRAAALPASYISDSRPSVRDQGPSGLCWAFSVAAGVESNLRKNGVDSAFETSVLHMAYATSSRNGNTAGYDRTPDDGGNRDFGASYLMRGTLQGAVDEKDDPYGRYVSAALPNNRALSITQSKEARYTAQNVLYLGGEEKTDVAPEKLKEAVMKYGSVPCSMYWDGPAVSGGNNSSAYYNGANAAYYYDKALKDRYGELEINHSVTIIGWDDNFSREKFNASRRPSGNGAWLVQNSWGEDWGKEGTFWLSYEDTNAPIYPFAVDGVAPYDADARIYEYDPHGYSGSIFYINYSTIFSTNIFTAEASGESLKEVKLFVPTPDTGLKVYVVENYTGASSLNVGGRQALVTESVTWPGWYTFPLEDPVRLGEKGSKFAVVVEYTVRRGEAWAPMCYPYDGWGGWPRSSVTQGVSYISYNGTTAWERQSDGNANIKAVTVPSGPDSPPDNPPDDPLSGLSNFAKLQTYDGRFTDLNWAWEWVAKAYEYGIIAGTGAATYGSGDAMTVQNALVIASKMHGIYHYGAYDYDRYGAYPDGFIAYALENKIIDSRFAGQYSRNATRGELAYIWGNVLPESELPSTLTYPPVPDVPATHPYYGEIRLFYEAGIVSGNPDGTFSPDSAVTRDQCAVMFVRLISPADRSK